MSDLQPLVLRAMLKKDAWETLGKVVSEDVVNDPAYRKLLSAMRRMHETADGDLTITGLRVDVTTTYRQNVSLREDLLERLDLIADADPLPVDQLEEVVRRFLSKEKLTKAVNWGLAHLDDEDINLEQFVELATDARDTSLSVDTDVATFSSYSAPDAAIRKGIVPLGFNSELNKALSGGIAKGELSVIMGAGGRGKTSHMAKVAVDAAKLGMNTLIVSLEINEAKYALMCDRCICGMTKQELLDAPLVALQRRARALNGEIWIKDWSHEKVTVSDLEALLDSMARQGKRVDVLIVDYWTILNSRVNYKDARLGFREIGVDLRRMANKYDVAVLTGWQANRKGATAESLTEEHIGEDYTVMWTADTIITLNQNPEENRNKRMRYGILKQREGTSRNEFLSFCDLDRMVIRDETAEDIVKRYNTEVSNVKVAGSEEVSEGASVERDA